MLTAFSTYTKTKLGEETKWIDISSDIIVSRAVPTLITPTRSPNKKTPTKAERSQRKVNRVKQNPVGQGNNGKNWDGGETICGGAADQKQSFESSSVCSFVNRRSVSGLQQTTGSLSPLALLSHSGIGNLSLVPGTAPGQSRSTSAFTAFCRLDTTYRSLHIHNMPVSRKKNKKTTHNFNELTDPEEGAGVGGIQGWWVSRPVLRLP